MSNSRQESSPEGLGNIKHKQSILGQSPEALMDLEWILRGFVWGGASLPQRLVPGLICVCVPREATHWACLSELRSKGALPGPRQHKHTQSQPPQWQNTYHLHCARHFPTQCSTHEQPVRLMRAKAVSSLHCGSCKEVVVKLWTPKAT